jgi:DNA adenine methylase
MRHPRGGNLPRPFLKWAGGKTQLLSQFEALYPAGRVRRYIEPFLGSAAVFFQVRRLFRPEESILADRNEDLIAVYQALQQDVEKVIRHLRGHRRLHSKAHYYRTRSEQPDRLSLSRRAARFIYLNKTCFNGLYRVNGKGEFNVPMGRYSDPAILDAENLRAVGRSLQDVELRTAHFRETLHYAKAGDFIYFDPPYQPISETSYFTSYTKDSFGAQDQEELAGVFAALHHRGCSVMLSNSDSKLVRALYKEFHIRIHTVSARRNINSKGASRGPISEVVVLNYDPLGARPAEAPRTPDSARAHAEAGHEASRAGSSSSRGRIGIGRRLGQSSRTTPG